MRRYEFSANIVKHLKMEQVIVNLFGKKFLGPLKLEFDKLPSLSAVYIIASEDSKEFVPLYIGYSNKLRERLKQHPVFGKILSEGTLPDEVTIYYWEFDLNSREEAKILEATLIQEYKPKFNYDGINHSKIQEQIQKLKEEEETRSKQWFRSSIIASMVIVISTVAFYTSYIQVEKQNNFKAILEKELSISNKDFRRDSDIAKSKLEKLISELKLQQVALQTLDVRSTGSINEDVPKEIIKLNAKVSSIEANIREFSDSKVLLKMEAIEKAIEGSPEKVLSVPLIKNDLKNYKLVSNKELLRLEKSIEKLDSRLSFFETSTITLTLGLFFTMIAPVLISSFQKRRKPNLKSNHS